MSGALREPGIEPMSRATGRGTTNEAVQDLLSTPKFELMPFDSFGEQMEQLPDGATIAITTSPTLGIDATVEWTERAAAEGYEIIPHIAARYVEDRDHMEEIAGRITEAGVTDIFVPGGDREEPAGEYASAYEFLAGLEESEYSFEEVGITGYPEGHDFLDDETLAEAMEKKAPYATYIVTQLCYDPEAVVSWVEEIRGRGVELPVDVGIPGVLKYQRLLNISQKVGVGDSIDFLRKTSGILGFVRQFVGSRGKYTPDDILEGLAPYAGNPDYGIRNVHIYTFNQVSDTEDWRRGILNG
jgi:methylenetetrahydrofolate reductase (NADPH)